MLLWWLSLLHHLHLSLLKIRQLGLLRLWGLLAETSLLGVTTLLRHPIATTLHKEKDYKKQETRDKKKK